MTITQLHKEHGTYLLCCLRVYGVPNAECEDVRQNLYLKLLNNNTKIENTIVRGFCSTICHNAAFSWLRHKRLAPEIDKLTVLNPEGIEGIHPCINSSDVAKWELLTTNATTGRIYDALVSSESWECQPGGPTAYAVISDLMYGLTMKEIGNKRGVSKATVSRWMTDWRKWINKQLPKRASL